MNKYQHLLDKHNALFSTHITKELTWRKQQLKQLKKLVVENEHEMLTALAEDLGKPPQESWVTEVSYLTNDIDYVLKNLKKWMKARTVYTPIVAQPSRSFIEAEPLGTVLVIGAWNYPFQLILAPLIAAISAGNCALIKPSELAAASSALLAKLIPLYLDSDAFSVVEGAVAETTELLELPFDHIMYTGNGLVGKVVMTAAAKHLTPVTLELGGKSPVYIDKSSNLDVALQRLAWGKWTNAGQTCIAPDYVMVTEDMVEAVVDGLKKQINKMYGQHSKNSDSYGRIINERHTKRLQGYLEGQNIVVGGDIDVEQKYISPTIVVNPSLESTLMTEEIFGPILPMIMVKDFSEAVEFVNRREKPLAAYLFTKNKAQQNLWNKQISSGSQCINDVFMFHAVPELPFGGVGKSGMGCYSGKNGFDNFSHYKAIMKRPFLKDPFIRFAPFTDLKLKLLKLIR